MKTKKNNKLKMFNSLTKIMEGNKKIWINVKELEKAYKTFLDETNKLNLLKDEYEKDLKNLVDRKAFARKNIIIEAFPISNIIKAFGIEKGQKKVVKKSNFSKDQLRKTKDLELVKYSKSIWKEAKKLYTSSVATPENANKNQKASSINIHNYGLTGQMIDKLEIANVTLVETRLELKDAYEFKKQCSKKITAGIGKNIELLKNKLDLLITIFKSSDSAFYNDYINARSLKNVEVKQKKVKTEKSKNKKSKHKVIPKTAKADGQTLTKKELAEIKTTPVKPETKDKPIVQTVVETPVVKNVVSSSPIVKKAPVRKPVVRKPAIKKVETKTNTISKNIEKKDETI